MNFTRWPWNQSLFFGLTYLMELLGYKGRNNHVFWPPWRKIGIKNVADKWINEQTVGTINGNLQKPVGEHFALSGHFVSDLKVMVLFKKLEHRERNGRKMVRLVNEFLLLSLYGYNTKGNWESKHCYLCIPSSINCILCPWVVLKVPKDTFFWEANI